MAFHNIQFPADISRGATSRTRRLSDIIALRSGAEMVNTVWKNSRHEYDVGVGIRKLDQIYDIIQFYESRMGRANSFRFKDWLDYKSCPPNGTISNTDQKLVYIRSVFTPTLEENPNTDVVRRIIGYLFDVRKVYEDDFGSYSRKISKPVRESLIFSNSTVRLASEAIHEENKIQSGIILTGSEAAKGENADISCGFEFDVPVRFAEDTLDASIELFNAGQLPTINLVEVML